MAVNSADFHHMLFITDTLFYDTITQIRFYQVSTRYLFAIGMLISQQEGNPCSCTVDLTQTCWFIDKNRNLF